MKQGSFITYLTLQGHRPLNTELHDTDWSSTLHCLVVYSHSKNKLTSCLIWLIVFSHIFRVIRSNRIRYQDRKVQKEPKFSLFLILPDFGWQGQEEPGLWASSLILSFKKLVETDSALNVNNNLINYRVILRRMKRGTLPSLNFPSAHTKNC